MMIDTNITTLIEKLTNENTFLGYFFLLAVLLLPYLPNIPEFIEKRKNAKIKLLSDALECEHIEELMREHLESELSTRHFHLATGINAEKDVREAILHTIDAASGELKLNHFKHAFSFLTLKGSTLSLHVPRFEKFFYRVSKVIRFMSFGMLLFTIFFAILSILVADASKFAFFVTMAAVSFISIYCSVEHTFRVSSAEIIQRYLQNNVNSATQ